MANSLPKAAEKQAAERRTPCSIASGATARAARASGRAGPAASARLAGLSRRDARGSYALACAAAVLLLLAAVLCNLAQPQPALAQAQPKNAVPTIAKAVSSNGRTYGSLAQSKAGGRVSYRLTATLPEDVADLAALDYTFVDVPDDPIAPDAASVVAKVCDRKGAVKADVACLSEWKDGCLTISLKDLKRACPTLEFGDLVLVEYGADVDAKAAAGMYPNVAKLRYDLGQGAQETVQVVAKVTVPDSPAPGKDDPSPRLPKTGDDLPALGFAGAAAIAGTVALWASTRRRRD